LHDVWPSPGLVHYMYISGGFLPPNGILTGAKFTFHANLAFSYIGSIIAWHSSSGRQTNFVAFTVQQRVPPIFGRVAIVLGIGPHSSFKYMTPDILTSDHGCIALCPCFCWWMNPQSSHLCGAQVCT